ncbi:NUDIX domain-containing protein [Ramlibacter sp. XY19]|nr:NUDIX domain-containing protein [Ramlibacter paludis]MCG2591513.1 NUDIX domain-containing protein [Ramlibacter paludis]
MEMLAFAHPLAGLQLVKGTIEPGETVEAAALRELREESGITQARIVQDLGSWDPDPGSPRWHFVVCAVDEALADHWTHQAADDGGHAFRFFWHPLAADPAPEQWHAVYLDALKFLRDRIKFPAC